MRAVKHVTLSDNDATGVSYNQSPELTCDGICPYCYAHKRTKKQAERLCVQLGLGKGLITSNSGPITWPTQQACYRRNTRFLNSLTSEGVAQEAQWIAKSLTRRGYDNLRFNGCGDSTPNSTLLAFYLGCLGKQAYGFTRKEEHVWALCMHCDLEVGSPGFVRPHFLLSVDRWSTDSMVESRVAAGIALNKCERVLAYMALADETSASIKAKPFWKYIKVVLGYHATMAHTRVGVARECPKTAGKGITCQQCRRCFSADRRGRR